MWESTERGYLTLNGRPYPKEALARCLGFACDLLDVLLKELDEFAVFSQRDDGAIFSRRMVRDEEIRKIRAEAGSKGGICSSKKRSKIQPKHQANTEDENEDEIETVNAFEEFWKFYPKKVGKGAALKAWAKISAPCNTLYLILEALKWQKASEQWTRDNGQYIPHPATYLNQRRWEDEPVASKSIQQTILEAIENE